ncbi:MAG: hypothetical protein ACYC6L_07025, partial [Anaerolineae bacterium]
PGDAITVAARLRYLLETLRCAPLPKQQAPAADFGGTWQVTVNYVRGAGAYHLELTQQGEFLSGTLQTPYACALAEGRIAGAEVTIRAALGYQSCMVTYTFKGRLIGGNMQGEVDLGEYGAASWQAVRR